MYIFLFFGAGLFLVSSVAMDKPFYDLVTAAQLFEDFIVTHGKSYPNNEEKQKRFEIFKDNLNHINKLNSVSEAIRAINKFTDLTTQEFVAYSTGLKQFTRRAGDDTCSKIITDNDITTNDAPDSLNWEQKEVVTPVKNQDPCQSCWAFAVTGTIESQYALKHTKLVSLSEQNVMDCVDYKIPKLGHCNGGGDVIYSLLYLNKTLGGLEMDSDYPYAGKDLKCYSDPSQVTVKIKGCINFRLTEEKNIKEALYQYGPIAISVDSTSWHYRTRGIYHDCTFSELNHSVLLVGYGTEGGKDYWLIKNSWGATFGEEGYIRIPRGNNACGIVNNDAVVAVVV